MQITNLFFKVNGTQFKIIGSESTGQGLYDCTDTILNLNNGNIAKINRKKLLEYLNN